MADSVEEARFVVYTAVFGKRRDWLSPPMNLPDNVPAYAFTDEVSEPTERLGWRLLPPVWRLSDPRRQNRIHKILSHRLFAGAEYSLYVDGNITPQVDPRRLVAEYLSGRDICVFRHAQRSCIVQELEACVGSGLDAVATMRTQVERYLQEGYPRANGLVQASVLLRRHSDRICVLNELWWDEVRRGSVRDQLSFPYAAWRANVPYATFRGSQLNSHEFQYRPHVSGPLDAAWSAYWGRRWEELQQLREYLDQNGTGTEVRTFLAKRLYPRWVYVIKDWLDLLTRMVVSKNRAHAKKIGGEL